MKGPEGTFSWLVGCTRYLNKAIVERQRMSNRVLPALLVLSVERKQVHNKLIDLAQRQHFCRRILDGHRDERDVGVRWLGVRVAPAIRFVIATAGRRVTTDATSAVVSDASTDASTAVSGTASQARITRRRQIAAGTPCGRRVAQ